MQIHLLQYVALLGAVLTTANPVLSQNKESTTQTIAVSDLKLVPYTFPDGFYPIMPWEPGKVSEQFAEARGGLDTLADCGFTVAAFVRPEQIARCEKLGLKALVCESERRKWQNMSDEQIEAAVKKLVDAAGSSPAVLGYFITDEPGVTEFPALGKAVAAVKRLAPGKLAYINLFPNYAKIGEPNLSQLGTQTYTEYLERYVNEVRPQFISYDNYRVEMSGDLKDVKRAESYYTNLVEARRVAQKYGLPLWHIVSSNRIRPASTIPSPANLAFQAYTTLAAGAECLTWFTYYQRGYTYAPIDTSGTKTATWSYLRMVNEQVKVVGKAMRGLKSTGLYFTAPAPAESLPKLPGRLVRDVESSAPLMLGEFSGAGDSNYVMAVNLSLEQTNGLVLKMQDQAGDLEQLSPADGTWQSVTANAVCLPAGQGVLIRARGWQH